MKHFTNPFSGSLGTIKNRIQLPARFLAVGAALALASAVAHADDQFYGTVEANGGGEIIVKTTKHSTGHGKVDAATQRTGSVTVGDWVSVEVETSPGTSRPCVLRSAPRRTRASSRKFTTRCCRFIPGRRWRIGT